MKFAIFAEAAEAVDLCLFRAARAAREFERVRLQQCTNNAHHEDVSFLPPAELTAVWTLVLDTSKQAAFPTPDEPAVTFPLLLASRSFALLRHAR